MHQSFRRKTNMDAPRRTTRKAIAGAAVCAGLIVAAIGLAHATSNQPAPRPSGCYPYQTGMCPAEIEGVIVTTTTSTVDLSWMNTTTTMTPDVMPPVNTGPVSDDCWIGLARQIGWPEHTLGTLQRIIQRESGCNPEAYADRPSTLDNSRGLLQINAYGSLADGIRRICGIEPETLFDPAVNLTCGLTYWQSMGWRPWGGGA